MKTGKTGASFFGQGGVKTETTQFHEAKHASVRGKGKNTPVKGTQASFKGTKKNTRNGQKT